MTDLAGAVAELFVKLGAVGQDAKEASELVKKIRNLDTTADCYRRNVEQFEEMFDNEIYKHGYGVKVQVVAVRDVFRNIREAAEK